jgi:hypothetical protein
MSGLCNSINRKENKTEQLIKQTPYNEGTQPMNEYDDYRDWPDLPPADAGLVFFILGFICLILSLVLLLAGIGLCLGFHR